MNHLAVITVASSPALIAATGDRAAYRFVEFFRQIRNPNTWRSYARAVDDFLAWLDEHGVASIAAVSSLHVATYIEHLSRTQAAPTVKLRLAAIRATCIKAYLKNGEGRRHGELRQHQDDPSVRPAARRDESRRG